MAVRAVRQKTSQVAMRRSDNLINGDFGLKRPEPVSGLEHFFGGGWNKLQKVLKSRQWKNDKMISSKFVNSLSIINDPKHVELVWTQRIGKPIQMSDVCAASICQESG
ncbi:MAG: hypothetical protein G8237_04715 [Magnetococcales bacterium]|nr:hypothetical protein [Magnetococcales bacterium]